MWGRLVKLALYGWFTALLVLSVLAVVLPSDSECELRGRFGSCINAKVGALVEWFLFLPIVGGGAALALWWAWYSRRHRSDDE